MAPSSPRSPRAVAREVLETEAAAIRGLLPHLDERFDRAVALILEHTAGSNGSKESADAPGAPNAPATTAGRPATGRVVTTGMGKSGLIMKKVAATLASTGTPSLFLHPAEALHGDLGMLVAGDVVLAASFSGTTDELLRLVPTVQRLGVPLVVMTGSDESPLARAADLHLPVPIDREACPLNLAPTASTTATLALADALAMALSEARGFTSEDFGRLHPGGRLGKRLLAVGELMHSDESLPRVGRDAPLRDAIYEMSKKGLGITAVTDDDDRLLGCISDGDLRRLLEQDARPLEHTAGECMTTGPVTIGPDELAPKALHEMEERRITSLFVCNPDGRLEGVVHLHDLWGLELF